MDSSRKKFYQCFELMLLTLFATGCLSFRLNADYKLDISIATKLLKYLTRFIVTGCFIAGWVTKVYSHRYSATVMDLSPLLQFLAFVELVITLITYIEVWLAMDVKSNQHFKLYENAFELDYIFNKEFGVNFNYDEVIRKNCLNVKIMIIFCGIYYISFFLSLDPDWRVALLALGYFLCSIGPIASSFGYLAMMDFLLVRFRIFRKLITKNFNSNRSREEVNHRRIFLLLNYYRRYCDIVHGINNIYGNIAMANYFHDFTQCSCMVFVLCHRALQSNASVIQGFLLLIFILPRIYTLVSSLALARVTVQELRACARIITSYDDHYPTKEVREYVDTFLLWKKNNGFQFYVGSTLEINFGLLNAFVQGIGNYVLILVQLKFQETSIIDRSKGKELHSKVEVL